VRQSEIIEHQVRSAAQPAAAEGPPGIRPRAGSAVNQDGKWPAFWNPERRLWGRGGAIQGLSWWLISMRSCVRRILSPGRTGRIERYL
jgi:hypothetical protein